MTLNESLVQPNLGEALRDAILRRNIGLVKLLLRSGANGNRKSSDGRTLLHCCVCLGHVRIVELLITEGHARVNATDDKGDTPLHYAIVGCELELVKVLVQYGADLEITNHKGKTPMEKILRGDWYGFTTEQLINTLLNRVLLSHKSRVAL